MQQQQQRLYAFFRNISKGDNFNNFLFASYGEKTLLNMAYTIYSYRINSLL